MSTSLLAHARRTWRVLEDVYQRFESQRCTEIAAALAFTSILALVPLLVVVFAALSLFPAFAAWQGTIETFIFHNFVPAMGEQVQSYLLDFTAKAKTLRSVGIAFLVITVLSMMSTIESTFNVIWGVRRRRPLALRFLVYWAVLTLGPLLIGIGIVTTSYLVSLPLLRASLDTGMVSARLLEWLPITATGAAFVLCYKVVPYRPVQLAHALIGGISAAVLFETAKRLFALYVANFPTQQAVYGAFATVPIFLLWVYLSWVIVLLGAQLTHSLGVVPGPRQLPRDDWRSSAYYCGYRLLRQLYLAQRSGDALSDELLRKREPALDHAVLNETLLSLEAANWVGRDEHYDWLLTRDLDDITLADLARVMPPDFAHLTTDSNALAPEDLRLQTVLLEHAALSTPLLGRSLTSLFLDDKRAGAEAPSSVAVARLPREPGRLGGGA